MDTDLQILIVGVLLACGLIAIAYSLLRRGQLEAQATRDAALRRAATDNAAQKTVLDALDKHLAPLKTELETRLVAIEQHMNAFHERLETVEGRQSNRPDTASLEGIRAQLRSTQDLADRHLAEARDRLHEMEQAANRRAEDADARLTALVETMEQRLVAGRESLDFSDDVSEDRDFRILPRHEPEVGRSGLSVAQADALAHVYWELEAVASAVQQKLAAIPSQDDADLSAQYAEQLRNMPVLPIDQLRHEIAALGADTAHLFDTVSAGLDRLRAGEGAATAGTLRNLLTGIGDDVRTLLARLEEITAAHEG